MPDTASTDPHAGLTPVVICTAKRGVFFGWVADPLGDPLHVTDARMCIYWSSKTGGVQGLAATGPTDAVTKGSGSRIGATSNAILKEITAVFTAAPAAVAAWQAAPVYRG